MYGPSTHFCSRSLARTSVLVSEVESDRRAARGSRAWPLAGSTSPSVQSTSISPPFALPTVPGALWGRLARAGGSGPGARAQPASRLTMSHGPWNKFLSFTRQPFNANSASHPCIRREILDACMQIGRWMAACYHTEIVPGTMRHGRARSWLRARAGSRAASARTRASRRPGPAAARRAPVRIDF